MVNSRYSQRFGRGETEGGKWPDENPERGAGQTNEGAWMAEMGEMGPSILRVLRQRAQVYFLLRVDFLTGTFERGSSG